MIRLSRLSRCALVIVVLSGAVPAGGAEQPFPPATPDSVGLSPEAVRALADAVRGYVDNGNAVGAELLLIKNRRTVLHEAYGWRDRENRHAMQKHTLCNIRSMTKPITGAAVQLLIDRGALSLDDPVAKYIPGFRTEQADAITIKQLLTHHGGLPLTILSSVDEYPDLLAMADAVGQRGPEFEPGSKFWYSDSGTDVLAAVVQTVTGSTIDDFITRELLQPLGMLDTLYVSDMSDPRVSRIAPLYVGTGGTWTKFWSPDPEGKPFYPFGWGSQTLYSTPMDYARFLAMWLDRGKIGQTPLLSDDAITRTLTPVSPMSMLGSDEPAPTLFPHLRVWYGQMALMYLPEDADQTGHSVVIGHSGSDGTTALAWPDLDLMVLYFTQSRGGLSVLRLEEDVDRLIVHPRPDGATDAVPEHLQPYLGTYVANYGPFRNVEFTVLLHNGNLALDVPGQLVFDLKPPDDENRWYFQITDAVFLTFERDQAGAVTKLFIHEPGAVNELPKGKAEPVEEPKLDPAELQEYVGTYLEEEDNRRIRVLIHGNGLALKIPEVQSPLELYPPDENGLWSMRVNAAVRIRFNRNHDGRVVSFSVLLPDGTEQVRPRIDEDDEGDEDAQDEQAPSDD